MEHYNNYEIKIGINNEAITMTMSSGEKYDFVEKFKSNLDGVYWFFDEEFIIRFEDISYIKIKGID